MLSVKMVSVYVNPQVLEDLDIKRGSFTRSSYVKSLILKNLYNNGVKK
jgi:hypothetical protein